MSAIFDNNIGRVVGWGEKNKQISVQKMARAWAVDSSECQAQFNRTASVRSVICWSQSSADLSF